MLFNLHSRQYPCVLERILANPVLSSHPSLCHSPSHHYTLKLIYCTVYMRLKRNKYRNNIYLNQTFTMKQNVLLKQYKLYVLLPIKPYPFQTLRESISEFSINTLNVFGKYWKSSDHNKNPPTY